MSKRPTVMRDIEAAPGGWRFTVPQTGVTITGSFASQTRGLVRAHLRANSLPDIPDEDLNEALCAESGLGDPWCGSAGETTVRTPENPLYLTGNHVAQFLRTALRFVHDRKLVSREEAERRVGICMNCPLATHIPPCPKCYGFSRLFNAATAFAKKMDLPVEEGKTSCGACGCVISVLAWIDNATLDRSYKVLPDYHPTCWRRKENSQ